MSHKLLPAAILAISLASGTAHASAIYGLGVITCQKALTFDWLAAGIFAWVGGYATAVSTASKQGDISPNQSTTDLVAVVFRECQSQPFITVFQATDIVMTRLWQAQTPAQSSAPNGAQKF